MELFTQQQRESQNHKAGKARLPSQPSPEKSPPSHLENHPSVHMGPKTGYELTLDTVMNKNERKKRQRLTLKVMITMGISLLFQKMFLSPTASVSITE